jgi:glutathionylspermidine synthase
MSENVAKANYKARIQHIEENILYKTLAEIAQECGVNPRTIDRDIVKWKANGGFDKFLDREFFQLYGKEKLTNPSRALDRVVTLMIRRIPETETKPEQPNKFVIEIVDPDSQNKVQKA